MRWPVALSTTFFSCKQWEITPFMALIDWRLSWINFMVAIIDLSDVICYVNFSNILYRNAAQNCHAARQKKAENMFQPEGIVLDMKIGPCQLSKLYAYNGLMPSGGTRIDGIESDNPHRMIVIDNPEVTVHDVPVITVIDKFMPLFPALVAGTESRKNENL